MPADPQPGRRLTTGSRPTGRLWPITGGWKCPECDNIICSAWQASHPKSREPSPFRGARQRATHNPGGGRAPGAHLAPSTTPHSVPAGPGHPAGSSGPRENTEGGSSLQPSPRTLGGPWGPWDGLARGQEGRTGEGRQGGTQLTLPPAKRRWRRCPLPCPLALPPASCLPHLITEMSSPEGSLLLLTVPRYLPPAASAAILVSGGEPAGGNGAKAGRTLQLTSPRAHQ